MIRTYKDIDHNTKEGKLLLVAIGTLLAYSRHTPKPYDSYQEVIDDLNETGTLIDADIIIENT